MKLFFRSLVLFIVIFFSLGIFSQSFAATTPYCRVTLNSNATQIKYGGDGPAGSTVRLWALNKASSPIDSTKVSPYLSSYDSGTWHAAKIAQCSLSGNGACSQDFFNFSLPSGTYDMYCDVQGPSSTLCSGDGFPGQATNTASCQGTPLADGTNPGPISRNFSSSGSNAGSAIPSVAYCSVNIDNKDESNPSYNEITLSYKGKGGTVTLYIDPKGTPLPGSDFGLRGFFSPNYGQAYSPQDQAQIVGKPTGESGRYIFGKYSDGNDDTWFTSNVVTKIRNVDDNIGPGPDVIVGVYKYIRGFSGTPSGFDANASDNVFHYTPAQCNGDTTECRESGLKMRFPKNARAWVFCGVRYSIGTVVDKLQCIGNPVCAYNGGPQSNPQPANHACGAWKQSCDLAAQKNPAGVLPVQHTDYVSYDPSNLCTPGAMCPDGSICKADGTCGGACDNTTNKCPTGNVCNTTTGKCGPGCTNPGSVCSNGQICQADGSCSPCTNSNQCSATQICSSGTCVDACTGQKPTNDCKVLVADGHTCSEKDAPDGSTCNNNNGTCKSGVCIDTCKEDANCKNGQVCQLPDGICVDACKNDSQCKNGNLCINNRCLPPVKTALKFDLLLQRIGKNNASEIVNRLPDANTNPKTPTRELTAEIFSNADATAPVAIARGPITYNATSGTFQGSIPLRMDIPTGDYIVKIKTDRYLRKKFNGTVKITKDQENAVPGEVLIVGDIVTDNEVNILDYNTWVDCANPELPLSKTMADASSKYSSPACTSHPEKANADLDDDGYVSAYDFNILLQNLGIRFGD